jgi:hypothetical protein
MKHRWRGKPKHARKWQDEKRRHAPYYIAIGGTTVVVGLLVARWRWDNLDHVARIIGITMVLAFGGTVLAFGPLLYYISDKYAIWLDFPMREEWRQDLESTWNALTGYLSSRGVQWRRLRSWTSQRIVLGLDGGLRINMMVSDTGDDRKRRMDLMVGINRINERNWKQAEMVQRIIDDWPLLVRLKAGVDSTLAEELDSMEI